MISNANLSANNEKGNMNRANIQGKYRGIAR
jgi:hypothetical protein